MTGKIPIYISLGHNCLPAAWGVYTNRRKKKFNGYKTCPFDLMVSNYSGIVKCINENFKNFINIDFLNIIGKPLIQNTYYNFKFNHESPVGNNLYKSERWRLGPNHFINNNFSNFITRYNNRINNFKNYLNDEKNIITFIMNIQNNSILENNCKELRDALFSKYPKLSYQIIIISGINSPQGLLKTKIVKIISPTLKN